MTPAYLSAAFLLGMSTIAIAVYARAVAHGRRAYTHVVFAWLYVIVLTAVATVSVADESRFLIGVMTLANSIGAAAMFTVIGRFRRTG